MKKIFWIVGLLMIGGGTYVAAEVTQNKEYSWRYKMTVSVETPEGIKTGTAVREMNIKFEPRPEYRPEPYHVSFKMRGEAVAVDLGERGMVFVLITPDSYPEVTKTFNGPPPLTIKGAEYYSKLKNVGSLLDPNLYPTIVTFGNLSDPRSVELIRGEEFNIDLKKNIRVDRFEKRFGKNVKLKNILVEMTDQNIDWKIGNWLPWLAGFKTSLDGARIVTSSDLANNLGAGSFRIGDPQ